jgi:hypothetical protein
MEKRQPVPIADKAPMVCDSILIGTTSHTPVIYKMQHEWLESKATVTKSLQSVDFSKREKVDIEGNCLILLWCRRSESNRHALASGGF